MFAEKAFTVRSYVYLMIAVLSWGVEYPLMKTCSNAIGFMATGAVMFTSASVLLGLTLAFRSRRPASDRAPWPWGLLLCIGVLGIGINIFGLWGIKLTSLANSSTLARADVLFSLTLSAFIFRETIRPSAIIFAPIMLVGICLLTGILSGPLCMGNLGDGLMLCSALCVALNAFIIKRALRTASALVVGFCNSAITGVFFIAMCFISGEGGGAWAKVQPAVLWKLAALSGLAYLFYVFYNAALKSIPVWEVRLLCLLVPAIATLCGWAWLNEAPTHRQIIGMILICASAAGVIINRRLPLAEPILKESSNE
jgi:drug/metabolite transporter (DMT)-like permease